MPEELADLASLRVLHLDKNELTGPIPAAFGRMVGLRELSLSFNEEMTGPLPSELTSLDQLDAFLASGTELCVPSGSDFRTWLEGIHRRRVNACDPEPLMAYLTQAVQSRVFPVPLVAGERALLRVFVTAQQATSEGIPPVRARFYADGRETHVEDIPGKSTPIPTEVDEGNLAKSANAEIAADVIEPGLEMVIEVDPDGTLDEDLLVAKRIPETGRLAVEVPDMPVLDLTLIPFVWSDTHDSSIVDLVEAVADDPDGHPLLWHTRTLLPIGDLEVTAHDPVLSSSNDAHRPPSANHGHSCHGRRDGSLQGHDVIAGYRGRRGGPRSRPVELLAARGIHIRPRAGPQPESLSRAVRSADLVSIPPIPIPTGPSEPGDTTSAATA